MRFHEVSTKLVFCFVLLGSLVTIVAGIDNVYPFSNYPMYSKVFSPESSMVLHSVLAEAEDGQIVRLSAGNELKPFWNASFREALLVENDPTRIRRKLEAALKWLNARRAAGGHAPYRRLRLYRLEVPWNEFVRRRLNGEEVRSLFVENSTLRLEVGGEP